MHNIAAEQDHFGKGSGRAVSVGEGLMVVIGHREPRARPEGQAQL